MESTAQTIGSRAYNTEYTYNNTGIISGVESSHGEYKVVNSYDWDYLNRVTYRCIEVYTEENGWEEIGWQNISYKPGKLAGSTTSLVSALDTNSNSFQYTYDERGNIIQIKNHGAVEATYTYDAYDRLISETANGVTTTWTYDSNGNILTRTSGGTTIKYTYGDSTWKDLLTNYNGQAITYDNIGNPTKWGNTTYTWDAGRRLMTLNKSGVNASFTYNIDGYRTKKTVNGVTTEYYLDGDRIVGLKKGTDELFFIYDEKGYSIGFYYNGESYIYVKNLQGDVIGIVDKDYEMVVTYSYDAWGKLLSTGGDLASTLGMLNPFRYRGYVYDDETGLYYLNSRYYDAGVGRFLNADTSSVITASMAALTDKNLFAYCDSNPVMRVDTSGMYWDTILDVISLCYSAYCVVQDPTDELNWWGLVADVVCLALPVVAAGGVMVKATKTVATNVDTSANLARGVRLVDAYNEAEKAGDAARTIDYYVTASGDAIPATKNGFNSNLSKMECKNGKYYGVDSKGPLRVRVEKHLPTPGYTGPYNPYHCEEHFHIDRRFSVMSGKFQKNYTGLMEWMK